MKNKLLRYLISHKERIHIPIRTVQDLWYSAKEYYSNQPNIEMGGSYASDGDYISVTLNVDRVKKSEDLIRFKVTLTELEQFSKQIERKQKLERILEE